MKAAERVLVVSTERSHADHSIQGRIVRELRTKAERVSDLFKRWDDDHSGTVDRAEFARALRTLRIGGTDEEYGLLFDSWDEDGSGTIDKKEFGKAVRSLGFDVEQADTDAVFDSLDDDKSGFLEYKELNMVRGRTYRTLCVCPKAAFGRHRAERCARVVVSDAAQGRWC